MKKLTLTCGNCAWMQKIDPPEDKKEQYKGVVRGFCYFNPPAVFPLPTQTSSLAMAQGQQQVQMIPQSFRPVVDGDEPMCGRYAPDEETLKEIKKANACDGCEDCVCTETGEGCEC